MSESRQTMVVFDTFTRSRFFLLSYDVSEPKISTQMFVDIWYIMPLVQDLAVFPISLFISNLAVGQAPNAPFSWTSFDRFVALKAA